MDRREDWDKKEHQEYRRPGYGGRGYRNNRDYGDGQVARHYRDEGHSGSSDGKFFPRNYTNRGGGNGRNERRNYDRKRSRSPDRDRNAHTGRDGGGGGSNHGDHHSPERKRGSNYGYNYSNPRGDNRQNFRQGSQYDSRKPFNRCDTKASNELPPQGKETEPDTTDDIDDDDLRPISLNISCPAATNLVQQIEKRKLLFSKKETPVSTASSSSSVWQKTTFSDDSDGKVSAKFKRLMGMKDGADSSSTSTKDVPVPATQSKEYFNKLEKEYEVARTITHTQRGVGLGFGSAAGLAPRSTWK